MKRSLLTLLILSAVGCGITGPDKLTLRFEGIVTAQATGQPVTGAEIRLIPLIFADVIATATTDGQGHYSLVQSTDACIEAELGTFLSASGPGFDSQSVSVLCTAALQRFDFSLPPMP